MATVSENLAPSAVALLERLGIPVVVFAGDGAVLSCSVEAQSVLKGEGSGLLAELSALAIRMRAASTLHGDDRAVHGLDLARPNDTQVWRLTCEPPSLAAPDGCVVCALVPVSRKEVSATLPVHLRHHEVDHVLLRHGLSERERAVAYEIMSGATSTEIAERLDVTVHTVRRHTEKVLRKLRIRSRAAVAPVVANSLTGRKGQAERKRVKPEP